MNKIKITLFLLLRNFCFFVPVLVLFWQSNGLNYTQIMFLQSLFAVGVFLLEVPTGYFADVVGRKTSLVLGGLSWSLATIVYSVSTTFWQFLIAEILAAFSVSFISGADSSFIYDSLDDKKDFKKVYGNITSYSMFSLILANVIGGIIGKTNYRLTLFATVPFGILMLIVALTLKEPTRHKKIISKNYFKDLFTVLHKFLKDKSIFWIIAYSGIVYAFMQSALWLYQPYFTITGIDVVWYGVIFAVFQLIAALSSKFAHKYEKLLGLEKAFSSLFLLVSLSLILMGKFVFILSFIFAFLQQFVRGTRTIIINSILAEKEQEYQATLLSVNSMFSRLFYAMLLPFLGLFADNFGVLKTLNFFGIIGFVLGFAILLIINRTNALGIKN
ncbi:MFS transporter [Candidatus Woesearchaeota archaeon]|nr:MFS transporter [Candidatus Woesearchaeota archaeon]